MTVDGAGVWPPLIPPPGFPVSVTHPIEKGHSGLIAARPGVELLQGKYNSIKTKKKKRSFEENTKLRLSRMSLKVAV